MTKVLRGRRTLPSMWKTFSPASSSTQKSSPRANSCLRISSSASARPPRSAVRSPR
jgi:hypothetical protein